MVPHSDSGEGKTCSPCKGALALASGLGGGDLIDLKEVLMLDHQESSQVNIRLCFVYLSTVICHGYCRRLHSAVWGHCFSPQSLQIGCFLHYTAQAKLIFRNLLYNFSWLVFHCLFNSQLWPPTWYNQNSLTRTFSDPCIHSGSRDPSIPSYT